MAELLASLRTNQPEISLCVATSDGCRSPRVVNDGNLSYVHFPSGSGFASNYRHAGVKRCQRIVEEFRPDIIHVHGTESFYGLLATDPSLRTPIVASLQGLVGPSSAWPAYFGERSLLDVLRLQRGLELLTFRGLLPAYMRFCRAAVREVNILSRLHFVMGRTRWDRDYALSINPALAYFHVGELLREPFWNGVWRIDTCKPHSIVFTNAGHPRKGIESLLAAFESVSRKYSDATLVVAGQLGGYGGYAKHVRAEAAKLRNVVLSGALPPPDLARTLLSSHVFVNPSLIDNSPNSVCEAQLVGMPVVSTATGGSASLVENGRTGLTCSVGDSASIAERILEIWANPELAKSLGTAAREEARTRHSAETVMGQLMNAYQTILANARLEDGDRLNDIAAIDGPQWAGTC